jgi:hypothetical protein
MISFCGCDIQASGTHQEIIQDRSRSSRLEDRAYFPTSMKLHHSEWWSQSLSPRHSPPCRNRTPISTFTGPPLSGTDHTATPFSKLQHTRAKNDTKSLSLFQHRSLPTLARRNVSCYVLNNPQGWPLSNGNIPSCDAFAAATRTQCSVASRTE